MEVIERLGRYARTRGLDQLLTQFGADGWQLVQVLGEMNADLTFFFKQPRRDET